MDKNGTGKVTPFGRTGRTGCWRSVGAAMPLKSDMEIMENNGLARCQPMAWYYVWFGPRMCDSLQDGAGTLGVSFLHHDPVWYLWPYDKQLRQSVVARNLTWSKKSWLLFTVALSLSLSASCGYLCQQIYGCVTTLTNMISVCLNMGHIPHVMATFHMEHDNQLVVLRAFKNNANPYL